MFFEQSPYSYSTSLASIVLSASQPPPEQPPTQKKQQWVLALFFSPAPPTPPVSIFLEKMQREGSTGILDYSLKVKENERRRKSIVSQGR